MARKLPREFFTEEYLQERREPPRWLFHFTRTLDHAIKVLRSGALMGFPVLSLTENPAMSGPAGPVFVVDGACVKRRGVVLETEYRKQYRQEAEWKAVGTTGKPASIPLACVVEIGWFKSHERKPDKIEEIRELAERHKLKATPLWDWTKHWKRSAGNPYLNTSPTEIRRRLEKEEDPVKRRLMFRALEAWRLTQGNPLAKSAARVATRWLARGGGI